MPKTPSLDETMFMLGMFSLLDALLSQPMAEIARGLPLEDDLAAALLGEKSKAGPWLEHVRDIEQGDWKRVTAFLSKEGVELKDGARNHARAHRWARDMLGQAG
jgi:EAL and modified HD-GYP domain-containing signal transduction protein